MNIEELRDYCLSLKGAEECFPFDETTLVFKVMGKMFGYVDLEPKTTEFSITLKCDAFRAVELRERYSGVTPGYHSNKKYWNTVYIDSDVPDELLKELIVHSLDEVIRKLPKIHQEAYRNMYE